MLLFYLGIQMFFLFQKPEDGKAMFLTIFDQFKPFNYRDLVKTYYTCDFNYKNFTNNFDMFIVVHFFGWFSISFMCRDFWMLTAWQVYDEVTELAHSNYLNLFNVALLNRSVGGTNCFKTSWAATC